MTLGEPSRQSLRKAAFAGAAVTTVAIAAMLAARGGVDPWVWPAAAAALAVSTFLVGRIRTGYVGENPKTIEDKGDDVIGLFPDPVVLVDRRVVVVTANEAAFRLLPGLNLRHPLAFALRAPQVLDSVASVVATGLPGEAVYGGRVSTEPTFEVRIRPFGVGVPLDGATGGVSAAAAALFFRDLTPERRTETMRVDFIANVSHELRTPLSSLLGFIETLQGPARNDAKARERFLEIMRAQANRMARLIDDLLQLSRIELHAHVPPSQALELAPVVGHMMDVMAPLARERGVEVSFEAPAEPLVVRGDRDEMIRVVENLVENAIKYGGGGGRVEVGLRRLPGETPRAEFVVRDHGPGIAPEHLPRLTERFYRVDAGESRSQGGTGLGLAIVKHIVGRHRGRLAIESTPGQGSTVTVTLPALPAETAGPAVI